MKATANQTRNGRHALQEDSSPDIVITEVEITTKEKHVHNTFRNSITNANGLSFRLFTPTLLQNLEVLSVT